LKYYVIIVAGGKGIRMKSKLSKQFILIDGKPILLYSIQKFFKAIPGIEIIVALPKKEIKFWKKLCQKHSLNISHEIVLGGKTRFHSVKNALKKVSKKGIIAVHDGVRPLTSIQLINRCFSEAGQYDNAVPCIPIDESIRKNKASENKIIDRNSIVIIQTPQCFNTEVLKRAYKMNYKDKFTDDASVVEESGGSIHLIRGEKGNIKITSKDDLLIAGAILKSAT
jgi:2-C-methyl-D-erythritol 4-phosphate cytidylyltransferase